MPYLIHTDISNLSFEILRNKNLGLSPQDRVINLLINTLQTDEIWFPAFNYDFAMTKVFNPKKDKIQVGSINQHVMKMSNSIRTFTPMFSFIGLGKLLSPLKKKYYEPFSFDSEMGELLKTDSEVIFLGTSIKSFTFIHFIEEQEHLGYRYQKKMYGKIQLENESYETVLDWKVRPSKRYLGYDWGKISNELLSKNILRNYTPFGQNSYIMKLSNFYEVIKEKINNDPYYLLDSQTRKWVEPAIQNLQRPFQISDFENGLNDLIN